MVQGYPEKDSTYSNLGYSSSRGGFCGALYTGFESSSGSRFPVLPSTELRILVDIHMSNGVYLSQKNLSYEGLKSLVEKLEVLC